MVVFNKQIGKSKQGTAQRNYADFKTVKEITGAWEVNFDPKKNTGYFLQLENVKDVGIAEVKINGTDKGVLWTKPFRIGISDELQKGSNTFGTIRIIGTGHH